MMENEDHLPDLEQFRPRVLQHIRRLCRDHAEAEDLCQDVFVVLANKAKKLPSVNSVEHWVFGIARNVIRAHGRKSASRRDLLQTHLQEIGKSTIEELSEVDQSSWAARQLLDEFSLTLSEEEQRILALHLEEKTIREIAEALSLSKSGIDRKLQTIKLQLRRFIEERRDND